MLSEDSEASSSRDRMPDMGAGSRRAGTARKGGRGGVTQGARQQREGLKSLGSVSCGGRARSGARPQGMEMGSGQRRPRWSPSLAARRSRSARMARASTPLVRAQHGAPLMRARTAERHPDACAAEEPPKGGLPAEQGKQARLAAGRPHDWICLSSCRADPAVRVPSTKIRVDARCEEGYYSPIRSWKEAYHVLDWYLSSQMPSDPHS